MSADHVVFVSGNLDGLVERSGRRGKFLGFEQIFKNALTGKRKGPSWHAAS